MAGMGPPPKPEAQQRRPGRGLTSQTTRLPAEGRNGAPPAWPLDKRRPDALKTLWAELWRTPQATQWERLGWTRVVARYAKALLAAEQPGAPVPLLAEVRQLEDRLGLTPMSMLRLRWEIVVDEVGAARQARQEPTEDAQARRARVLRAVAGDQ